MPHYIHFAKRSKGRKEEKEAEGEETAGGVRKRRKKEKESNMGSTNYGSEF